MLQITIPARELWDETNQEFKHTKETTIQLEHSLVSISKWESKWCKAFLPSKKTIEETIDYIRCMTITQNVSPDAYINLSESNIKAINDYISAPMTAVFFNDNAKETGIFGDVITSELIYYWMFMHNIPVDFQKWHLNRLLALIRVCNIKSNPPKKISTQEVMKRNSALNAARKKQHNTAG